MTTIHLCRAPVLARLRRVLYCRSCRSKRRHVITDHGWYGFERVCCRCGLRYDDGWRRRDSKLQRRRNAAAAAEEWDMEPFDNSAEYWADYFEPQPVSGSAESEESP